MFSTVTRIYKQLDPSFSLICYYSFIFGLLRISLGLSVFGFIVNKYQRRAILSLSTIRNIRSAIRWAIPKVISNYSHIPRPNKLECNIALVCKGLSGINTLAYWARSYVRTGNTKGGSITVPLTSCLTGLESAVWKLTIFVLIAKQTNTNQSNRRSMVQWYFHL